MTFQWSHKNRIPQVPTQAISSSQPPFMASPPLQNSVASSQKCQIISVARPQYQCPISLAMTCAVIWAPKNHSYTNILLNNNIPGGFLVWEAVGTIMQRRRCPCPSAWSFFLQCSGPLDTGGSHVKKETQGTGCCESQNYSGSKGKQLSPRSRNHYRRLSSLLESPGHSEKEAWEETKKEGQGCPLDWDTCRPISLQPTHIFTRLLLNQYVCLVLLGVKCFCVYVPVRQGKIKR